MPTSLPSWSRWLLAFIAALLVGTLLGSLVQTQFNLLAIQSMGFPVPLDVRLVTSAQDLLFFGPVFAALFGGSFLVSQPVALLINRWLSPVWHPLPCALGAALGLAVTLKLVDALAPMPTLIAATRSTSGTLALLACAALAGGDPWAGLHRSAGLTLQTVARHTPAALALGAIHRAFGLDALYRHLVSRVGGQLTGGWPGVTASASADVHRWRDH